MNPVLVRLPPPDVDEVFVLLGFDQGRAVLCGAAGTLFTAPLSDIIVEAPASDWPIGLKWRKP